MGNLGISKYVQVPVDDYEVTISFEDEEGKKKKKKEKRLIIVDVKRPNSLDATRLRIMSNRVRVCLNIVNKSFRDFTEFQKKLDDSYVLQWENGEVTKIGESGAIEDSKSTDTPPSSLKTDVQKDVPSADSGSPDPAAVDSSSGNTQETVSDSQEINSEKPSRGAATFKTEHAKFDPSWAMDESARLSAVLEKANGQFIEMSEAFLSAAIPYIRDIFDSENKPILFFESGKDADSKIGKSWRSLGDAERKSFGHLVKDLVLGPVGFSLTEGAGIEETGN